METVLKPGKLIKTLIDAVRPAPEPNWHESAAKIDAIDALPRMSDFAAAQFQDGTAQVGMLWTISKEGLLRPGYGMYFGYRFVNNMHEVVPRTEHPDITWFVRACAIVLHWNPGEKYNLIIGHAHSQIPAEIVNSWSTGHIPLFEVPISHMGPAPFEQTPLHQGFKFDKPEALETALVKAVTAIQLISYQPTA